jgi:hypothetical protein
VRTGGGAGLAEHFEADGRNDFDAGDRFAEDRAEEAKVGAGFTGNPHVLDGMAGEADPGFGKLALDLPDAGVVGADVDPVRVGGEGNLRGAGDQDRDAKILNRFEDASGGEVKLAGRELLLAQDQEVDSVLGKRGAASGEPIQFGTVASGWQRTIRYGTTLHPSSVFASTELW